MENKKIIDSGDLKERVEKALRKFNCIYDMDIEAINDPFLVRLTIRPSMCESFKDIQDLLYFVRNTEELANVTVTETGAIKNIREAFEEGNDFTYLLGTEEIKVILWHSYELGRHKVISKIIKVHEEIHILISEAEKIHR